MIDNENTHLDDNLQEGESIDGVEQTQSSEMSVEQLEATNRYMQSEKDKKDVENRKLADENSKMREVLGALHQRAQGGGEPQKVEITPDEFDPWEAYNDPNSKSYKFREQGEQERVGQAVAQQMQGVNQAIGMAKLENELKSEGLNPNEIKSFMEFASTPASDYGISNVVKMWRATDETTRNDNQNLDQVRQNQQIPGSAGVLQGQRPQTKSSDDKVWERVMKANSGGKLP